MTVQCVLGKYAACLPACLVASCPSMLLDPASLALNVTVTGHCSHWQPRFTPSSLTP